jgi:hypothetical protein
MKILQKSPGGHFLLSLTNTKLGYAGPPNIEEKME